MDHTQDYYDHEYMGALVSGRFPRPGARLRFRGTHQFWFTNIIANAERELQVGEIYTLKMIRLASSWACVTLEETGEAEYSLGFFDQIDEAPSVANLQIQ